MSATPDTYSTLHWVFSHGDRLSGVIAYGDEFHPGTVYLRVDVDNGAGISSLTLSGPRAEVEQAVDDIVRALAALDSDGAR